MYQAFYNYTYQLEDREPKHGNHITRLHTFFTEPLLCSYRIPSGLGGNGHHNSHHAASNRRSILSPVSVVGRCLHGVRPQYVEQIGERTYLANYQRAAGSWRCIRYRTNGVSSADLPSRSSVSGLSVLVCCNLSLA